MCPHSMHEHVALPPLPAVLYAHLAITHASRTNLDLHLRTHQRARANHTGRKERTKPAYLDQPVLADTAFIAIDIPLFVEHVHIRLHKTLVDSVRTHVRCQDHCRVGGHHECTHTATDAKTQETCRDPSDDHRT